MSDAIAQFARAKYLSLETFRKSGVGVKTPVWFAQAAESPSPAAPASRTASKAIFYVYSESSAGKLKRIRNNPRVRIAPCNFRGRLRGEWMDAQARICDGEEAVRGQHLLRRKYGLQKIIGDFFSRLMGHGQALIVIEVT